MVQDSIPAIDIVSHRPVVRHGTSESSRARCTPMFSSVQSAAWMRRAFRRDAVFTDFRTRPLVAHPRCSARFVRKYLSAIRLPSSSARTPALIPGTRLVGSISRFSSPREAVTRHSGQRLFRAGLEQTATGAMTALRETSV